MEQNNKQEYITNEMINTYMKKHTYHDNNGVVHKIDNKFILNDK